MAFESLFSAFLLGQFGMSSSERALPAAMLASSIVLGDPKAHSSAHNTRFSSMIVPGGLRQMRLSIHQKTPYVLTGVQQGQVLDNIASRNYNREAEPAAQTGRICIISLFNHCKFYVLRRPTAQ